MQSWYRPHITSLLLFLISGVACADVIVLVSDDKPSFLEVADAITRQYQGKVERFSLKGDSASVGDIAKKINESPFKKVIAIGSLAAKTARQKLSNKSVVFCQVLNYDQFDLVTPWMKGVSALPPLAQQFRAWRILSKDLKKIGVITGNSANSLLIEARDAAAKNQIELVHAEVNNDREVMFALKRMAAEINGLWLAPDSSIISSRLLTELMTFSVKEGLQILVFSPDILKMGGLISASALTDDIAKQVLARIDSISANGDIPGGAIQPLSTIKVDINDGMTGRFGVDATDVYKEYSSERRR